MKTANYHERVFPVAAGDVRENTSENVMLIRQIFGTCYSIGNGFFLTAAHVIRDALCYKWVGVGFPADEIWQGTVMDDSEMNEDYDIGIIRADIPKCVPLKWAANSLYMLQPIYTVGYAYALELRPPNINIRSFAGHIVSNNTYPELKAAPRIYELSFQSPRGLSGAPLFSGQCVNGLIIANRTTQMLISMSTEKSSEGEKEKTTETYEALQIGIALQSIDILDLQFGILGATLREHLLKGKLIS